MILPNQDIIDFETNGYLIKKNFLNSQDFLDTANELNNEIFNTIKNINLNNIGGSRIGNLNVFPGKFGKVILEYLKQNGLNNLIFNLLGKDINNFNISIGGNLCIPFGYNQHFHTDGEYNDDMIVINVATSEVKNESGPTEIIPKSHNKKLSYWQFLFSKKNIVKATLSTGDILIRKHNLWHRGTINTSGKPRFIIAFMLFDKKRKIISSNAENNSNIIISNNFFKNNRKEKLKEYIYCKFKFFYIFYKAVYSFFK